MLLLRDRQIKLFMLENCRASFYVLRNETERTMTTVAGDEDGWLVGWLLY